MTTPEAHRPGQGEQRVPRVTHAGVAALALLFSGGIYLASYLPHQPSLAPAIGLLAGAFVLVLWSVIALTRTPGFAWRTFGVVARWVLLAYVVISGMFVYMFLRNGTRGEPLVVMILMLVVFALAVTLLIAFTVARYDRSRR
ncbi:MAG: hypothetical protein IT201_07345 [Thermoleophilia bacterium]|nr:hypothetical protein [Thermoleophilia bacterium]